MDYSITANKHLDSLLDQQPMMGPVTSADQLAEYVFNNELTSFAENIGEYAIGENPHPLAYAIDHKISRGESVELEFDTYQELFRLNWLPTVPFIARSSDNLDHGMLLSPGV